MSDERLESSIGELRARVDCISHTSDKEVGCSAPREEPVGSRVFCRLEETRMRLESYRVAVEQMTERLEV